MKRQVILILLFSSKILFGQDTLKMDYYSQEYKFLIISNKCNSDSCFGVAYISISDRKTNQLISKIRVDNFLVDNSYVTYKKSLNQIPPPIFSDDYNFDNFIDLAFRNGYAESGNPKYDFYIFNKSFELDSTLTSLSKKKGNIFTLFDKKQIEIVSVNKSGFRIREFYEYANSTRKLQIIERITEDGKSNPKYIYVTTESYNGDKKTLNKKKYLSGKYLWSEL